MLKMGAHEDQYRGWLDANMQLSVEQLTANIERYQKEISNTDPNNYRYSQLNSELSAIQEALTHKIAGDKYVYGYNLWVPKGYHLNNDTQIVPDQTTSVTETVRILEENDEAIKNAETEIAKAQNSTTAEIVEETPKINYKLLGMTAIIAGIIIYFMVKK